MQLNTTSYQSILDSLCNELDLNEQVILDTIDSGYYMFQQDHQILYIDDLYECYFNIVKRNFKGNIDKVPFYSISRRLKDTDNDGLSLLELLTEENSFSNYLNKIRIEQSKLLLKNTDSSIVEIALEVGFEDQSYFSKVFKNLTKMTPKQYRQNG